jgi:hypothetical protein
MGRVGGASNAGPFGVGLSAWPHQFEMWGSPLSQEPCELRCCACLVSLAPTQLLGKGLIKFERNDFMHGDYRQGVAALIGVVQLAGAAAEMQGLCLLVYCCECWAAAYVTSVSMADDMPCLLLTLYLPFKVESNLYRLHAKAERWAAPASQSVRGVAHGQQGIGSHSAAPLMPWWLAES